MKIFNQRVSTTNSQMADKKSKGKKISPGPLSEDDVRQKIQANADLSQKAKAASELKFQQKLGDGFMNENIPIRSTNKEVKNVNDKNSEVSISKDESEAKDPNFKDHLVKSDVGTNDPKDVTTTEKLKAVLSRGAFNFSSKEREALGKILEV